MNNLQKEETFFHYIAKKVRETVSNQSKKIIIAQHKKENDFSTQIDVDVENLIVKEINRRFPQDQILAEETHTATKIPQGRIWIIDPICGTNNLARGIRNFCTNIALADNNKLIASCVVDHSQNDYFWSTGRNEVFVNDVLFESYEKRFDIMIDVDFGATTAVDKSVKEKHNRFLRKLITENNYYLLSLNSSLGFAYTAIGKVDGFLSVFNNLWDISAASFLIQQAGGVISDLLGNPWTLKPGGTIAAKNKEIHRRLLEAYLSSTSKFEQSN